ncbi:hypothetical protein [Sphingomonas sp. CROZ-RG-20F-R02-07]|uniref:hypothetical protein n=1 Tax=Sphingomonas sp. CROZ-RG-20F-R02-07 TaxID=2914832 RepID=UPI001F580804|nr:hypothetical protein [Sphingomonas sp. CROZ-RG-20F-R02-07]
MRNVRSAAISAALVMATTANSASAQFFLQPHDMSGQPVRGDEADIGLNMPGATAAEQRAAMIWTMRSALNVAALQCQFEPTLLVVSNYNALLTDHKDELKTAMDGVSKYYTRMAKTKKAGQDAFDQFNTRSYSAYATVNAQYNFCQTANSIGREAIFTPRGQLGALVEGRMRELRNSLTPWGEQRFPRYIGRDTAQVKLPRLDAICWDKKANWVEKKCGPINWPPAMAPAAVAVAAPANAVASQ